MDIQFLGAAKMVTGSNFLIKMKKYNIIVDCGMFQGNNEKEELLIFITTKLINNGISRLD